MAARSAAVVLLALALCTSARSLLDVPTDLRPQSSADGFTPRRLPEVIVPRSVATTTGARPTVTPVPTPVPITGGRTGVQTRVDPSVPSRTSTTPTSPSRVPSTTDTVGHAVETAVDIADAALESPDTPDSLETPESTGSASDLPDSEIYQNPVPNGQPVVSPVASAPLDAQAPQGDSADIDCDPYTSCACSIEGSIPG